jgi:hypothetical protein
LRTMVELFQSFKQNISQHLKNIFKEGELEENRVVKKYLTTDELLERIRDIRSSEKRFYQKIRDIYKLAVDYGPKADETLCGTGAKSWTPFCNSTKGTS